MFQKLKEFFFGKPAPAVPEAPYKIEAPQQPDVDAKASTQTKCGCGRSQSGFCIGLHKLTPDEWAVHPDNPAKPKRTRTRKAPAEKPVAPKKPRAKKAATK